MELHLNNKKVFVSGSTQGIGLETARQFLKEGCRVTLNGRTEKSVTQAIGKLKEVFPQSQIDGFVADFSSGEGLEKKLEVLKETDILINNLGIFQSQNFADTGDLDWQKMWEVNVMSGVRLCRTIFPAMLQRKWGRVVFVSSECAQLVPPDLIAYSATKAALHALAKGLSQQTKGTEVTVNTLMPGSTLSDGAQNFISQQAESQKTTAKKVEVAFFEEVRTSSQLGRFLTVTEVAQAIVFLCGGGATGINGSVLRVDGGSVGGVF